mmetsp:Transcript_4697/g.5334  ORF Transcript_4697/g.5334 Transcript_4697/m.5334 type:complete len:779 (+) Transcript_4697:140-2476(+)
MSFQQVQNETEQNPSGNLPSWLNASGYERPYVKDYVGTDGVSASEVFFIRASTNGSIHFDPVTRARPQFSAIFWFKVLPLNSNLFLYQSPFAENEYLPLSNTSIPALSPVSLPDGISLDNSGTISGSPARTCDMSVYPIAFLSIPLSQFTDISSGQAGYSISDFELYVDITNNMFLRPNRSLTLLPIDAETGVVQDWNETLYGPTPIASTAFWFKMNCQGEEYQPEWYSIPFSSFPRFRLLEVQYPTSPSFDEYIDGVLFSGLPLFILSLLLTFVWLLLSVWIVAKKCCKSISLNRASIRVSLEQMSREFSSDSILTVPDCRRCCSSSGNGCGCPLLCGRRNSREVMDAEKPDKEALVKSLEDTKAKLDQIIRPATIRSRMRAFFLVLILIGCQLIFFTGFIYLIISDFKGLLEHLTSTQTYVHNNATALQDGLFVIQQTLPALEANCSAQLDANSTQVLENEIENVNSTVALSNPDMLIYTTINKHWAIQRVFGDGFSLPVLFGIFSVVFILTSLTLLLASLLACCTFSWGDKVGCTDTSLFLGQCVIPLAQILTLLNAFMCTLTYVTLVLSSDICRRPSFLQANPNVVYSECSAECQMNESIYDFEARFNLAAFFYSCEYEVSNGIYNPYFYYLDSAATSHIIFSEDMNSTFGQCENFTQPNAAIGIPNTSYHDFYDSLFVETESTMQASRCSTYGNSVGLFIRSLCQLRGFGSFLTFIGTLFTSIFGFALTFQRQSLIPNLYRIDRAEKLHRKILRKLEVNLPTNEDTSKSMVLT